MNKHPDFITTKLLGSGYAAIHCRWYADIQNYDVQQTGISRYRTMNEAVIEAKQWAEAEEIEYRE